MQRVSGGYTIIEVIIFLAVSSALLLVSLIFLSGREGHVRFSQSMRDMQSKVQDWVNDVTDGFPVATDASYNCQAGGSSVVINQGARNINSPPTCIFLGKAIQFTDAPSNLVYTYSVFGQRLDSSNELVSNMRDTAPVPAIGLGTNTGDAHLTDIYTINGGAEVKSISGIVNGSAFPSHMAGFYLSLNTEKSIGQNGNTDLKAFQYKLQGSSAGDSQEVTDCIKMISSLCKLPPPQINPPALSKWEICFDNGSNGDTAVLTVNSTNGFGATTKLEFKAC
ncbi:hypothetical protein KW801_00905 [Candidatus Saccharibacteria bacterium]|nr:hypothetical protein [Candidatus Saccharibacteria bacterium]